MPVDTRSGARLAPLFDNLAIGVALVEGSVIVDVNPALAAMLGWTREELRGVEPGSLTHPDDRAVDDQLYDDVLAHRRPSYRIEKRYLRRDGSVFWGRLTLSRADGERHLTIATLEDITKERSTREEAIRRGSELQAVFRALPDLYFRLASDGTILDYQAGKTSDLYLSPVQFLGRRMQDVLPPEQAAAMGDGIARVIAGDGPQTLEYTLDVPRGTQHFEARILPLGGDELVMVVRNVTDRRRAEQEREDLIHAVSHDLRGPLTVIQLQAERLGIMIEEGAPREGQARSVSSIVTAALRLATMIRDLVEAARVEAVKCEPTSLELAAFVDELLGRAPAGIDATHTVTLVARDLVVRADPDHLERVLVNLLSNAFKYSPPGSDVRVRADPVDGEVVIAVVDRGPGIAPEDQSHLFQRFWRGQRSRGKVDGLGLGLFIASRLVALQGGRIWVESVPGAGSTFCFTLPAG